MLNQPSYMENWKKLICRVFPVLKMMLHHVGKVYLQPGTRSKVGQQEGCRNFKKVGFTGGNVDSCL